MSEFSWPVRVYYEDTDSGGVVYYANYLRFMERARTEWLRHLGFEQDVLREEEGILFAVRSVQVDYHRPARFNDALTVGVAVEKVGRASLDLFQTVSLSADDGEGATLCSGRVRIACVRAGDMRACAIPQAVYRVLGRTDDNERTS